MNRFRSHGLTQMLVELTAAQEDALLSDVTDYLDVTLGAESGIEYPAETPEPQGDESVNNCPREPTLTGQASGETPFGSPIPGGVEETDGDEDAHASGSATGDQTYRSPSGTIYATKVKREN